MTRDRHRIDLVLAAGDITIPGYEDYAEQFIDCVRKYDLPLLLVHGNNDSRAVVDVFRREAVTIHRRPRELFGRRFAGIGGDGHASHDNELQNGEVEDQELGGAILITHVPPSLRLTLRKRDSISRPSPERVSLLAGAPAAHLCGHIHHTEGVAFIGSTKVIKLRAAMWNACALLDLETLRTTFLPLAPQAGPI